MFAPLVPRSGPTKDMSPRGLSPPSAAVGPVDDPLEKEADNIAGRILDDSIPDAQARMPPGRASVPDAARAGTGAFERPAAGETLPERGFFERRFGRDFSSVRVHRDGTAGASARALGARAYAHGNDIVFGAGHYSPSSRSGRALLAHELAHVVQQGGRPGLVQLSPLSDSVKAAWTAEPRIEALLARLGQDDVRLAQGDKDVDAEINALLAGRPDDLWVALRIRRGELGRSTGAFGPKVKGKPVLRPVEAFFFRGSTDRRALVIAGVHGSERQGMEVVEMLMADLRKAPQPPAFTTIVVPSLFPDSKAKGDALVAGSKSGILSIDEAREGSTPTNRNFPDPSKGLAAAGGAKAVDQQGRAILPENRYLMELMERFRPERIVSVHGTRGPGSAGVFYDPRALRADEEKAALDEAAAAVKPGTPRPSDSEGYAEADYQTRLKAAYKRRLAEKSAAADATDRDLSLKAAEQIDKSTQGIKGRDKRRFGRDTDSAGTDTSERKKHPSVAGNIGPTGAFDNAFWSGGVPGGVSLGGYAPKRGMSVFTVEPPLNYRSDDPTYLEKLARADRKIELQAYADAIRTILLGSP